MTRQESFEQHWADMHDLPVETVAQYRWAEQDGYRLPGIAAGYRNYCAGWDAFEHAAQLEVFASKIQDACLDALINADTKIEKGDIGSEYLTVKGPRYE